ncbi:MAG: transcriptional repressor NrdR [Elusimicrobia bacterium]|nr:transcriptional repressor NrdR [Elusimicrobiota bacterium]
MKCPYCVSEDSKVIDTRPGQENNVIRRRRECLSCHKRFSTYERIEPLPLMIIKSNGTREPFDPAKVRNGLIRACEKRPISIDTIEKLVAEIEYAVSNHVMEVPSKMIGEMAMDKLEKLDPVSYLRFASVFQGFSSLEDFVDLADKIREKVGNNKEVQPTAEQKGGSRHDPTGDERNGLKDRAKQSGARGGADGGFSQGTDNHV